MSAARTAPPAPAGGGGGVSKVAKNPKVLLGAGLGVVVLAVLTRGGGAGGGTASTTSTGQITPNQGGYYDSTANDVYNSLMGQLEQLGQAQSNASSGPSTPTPAPTPAPVTTPAPAPLPVGSSAHVKRTFKPPARKPAPKPAPQLPVYTVRKGDTLSSIAARYHVKDWRSLYAANTRVIGSNPNRIKPGQRITIPSVRK